MKILVDVSMVFDLPDDVQEGEDIVKYIEDWVKSHISGCEDVSVNYAEDVEAEIMLFGM